MNLCVEWIGRDLQVAKVGGSFQDLHVEASTRL